MYPRIILFILFPLFGFSQAPQKINFQSILRNTNGEVVANKSVSLKISILSGSISGLTVYSETHLKITDASGLISLQIGNGTVLGGVFANIAWGDFPHFIKLEADFNGGSNYVVLGAQELMNVPYALYASKTDTSSLNLVNRFNSKVNISDTSNMLNPYLRKSDVIVSVENDPVFNSSIAKGITRIDTAYWNKKLNIIDTSSMLLNYRTGLNQKVSNADTSSMLINYLRKSDALILDLQNQLRLVQNHFKIQDIDGNTYNTITIGNQRWMAENLRVSRYRNGDIISLRTSNEWTYEEIGWRNWFNNDSATYEIPHGKLYNWYSANDNRGICPSGWHIPSKGEWQILSEFLGGIMIAGGKMKIIGTSHWNYPNVGATNESGFSAYPSGARYGTQFQYFGTNAFFWSSSPAYSNGAWYLNIYSSGEGVEIHAMYMNQETSVRCLKDL
jgi:uncharacterized protein (TIGR02145 family)